MNPDFYVLWNPGSPLPPKVRFFTLDHAKSAAEAMAKRHPGETFHVLGNFGGAVTKEVFWTLPEQAPF